MSGPDGIVVIGGGHAGAEAALAASRLGCPVTLLALRLDDIARLACNPAVGGVGKGQLVREIDALGGEMARAADASALQFKMLNASRGPAVQSPRVQVDKDAYARHVRRALDAAPGLRLREGKAVGLEPAPPGSAGPPFRVRLASGDFLPALAVVVCAGTFLRARLHRGTVSWPGGRAGEDGSDELPASLEGLGVRWRRLRTDTPPRVAGSGIDFSALAPAPGDPPRPLSFRGGARFAEEAPCYGVWTGEALHAAVRGAALAGEAPVLSGQAGGTGPRYCPNIESKVMRFPEVGRHHVFVEPEGRGAGEWYLNGLSTSLSPEAQRRMVRALPGFADAHVTRYGYAVEYDAAAPGVLSGTLEVKGVPGLFMAGQVNGTSGYEEAAAQGLLAGANAALSAQGRPPWRVGRHEAYLGVLVDDLAVQRHDEPYRLFTSRAERRLSLRHDNADLRLSAVAAGLGLASPERAAEAAALGRAVAEAMAFLESTPVPPGTSDRGGPGGAAGGAGLTLAGWLRRPSTAWRAVAEACPAAAAWPGRVAEQVSIGIKYAGYLARQEGESRRYERSLAQRLPENFKYEAVAGLSREARETLQRHRPETVAQAARLGGVGPADAALLAYAIRPRGPSPERNPC